MTILLQLLCTLAAMPFIALWLLSCVVHDIGLFFRRQFGPITMLLLHWGGWCLMAGCAPLSHDAEELSVAISCPTPFEAVLEAWESASGTSAPAECQHLDVDPPHAWCELGRVDDLGSEQHAWIHALSECAIGDPDVGHFRSGLWLASQPHPVEEMAWDVVEGCL